MKLFKVVGPIVLAVFAVVLWNAAFIVDETEQAIVTRFQKPIGEAIHEAGLYWKVPFVDRVHIFEDRYLEWSGHKNEIPTSEERFIIVDTYARWKITDPLKFYKRVKTESRAQSRLDDYIDGATRDAVADNELLELVRVTTEKREPTVKSELDKVKEQQGKKDESEEDEKLPAVQKGRVQMMSRIEKQASKQASDLGIVIKDVRFNQINYRNDVQETVFERMISERQRIAELYRSQGEQKAAEIRGEMERELKKIESEAFEKSEEIRGDADAKATDIYAEAYEKAPDFYQFMKTMESYKSTLDDNSQLLLSTDSEFFNYLKTTETKE